MWDYEWSYSHQDCQKPAEKHNGNNVGINKYETVTRSSENKNERTAIKQTNVEGEMKRAKEQTNEGKKRVSFLRNCGIVSVVV